MGGTGECSLVVYIAVFVVVFMGSAGDKDELENGKQQGLLESAGHAPLLGKQVPTT